MESRGGSYSGPHKTAGIPDYPSLPRGVPRQPAPLAITGVMGPLEIQQKMEEAIADLDRLLADVTEQIEELASDRRNYEVAFAQARIDFRTDAIANSVKVGVDQVNDHATVETADLKHHLTLSEERLKATHSARRAVESKLDSYRSMSAAIRGAGG